MASNQLQIRDVIQKYIQGVYQGHLPTLTEVFHPKVMLFGQVHEALKIFSLEEYLEVVRHRTSPKSAGEALKAEIMSIEICASMARVKVHFPMLGYNYFDFLNLQYIQDSWVIVAKTYVHVVKDKLQRS